MNQYLMVMYDFEIIGHRGAAGYEPENTLLSFEKAIDIGVDWIELDLRRSVDGHLVVIHDDTVDRTTNGSGKVNDLTFAELKNLNIDKGQTIPELQEVIDLARNKVKMVLEMKQPDIETDVIDSITSNNLTDRCMVASFNKHSIRSVKVLDKRITTAIIVSSLPIDFRELSLEVMADCIFIKKDVATKDFVDEAHKDGFSVNIWNTDTMDDIRKYASMSPDYMSSNYPDRLKKFKEEAVKPGSVPGYSMVRG